MRSLFERFSGVIQHVLVHPLRGHKAYLACFSVAILLVLALELQLVSERTFLYDLYFLPVLLSCLLFRHRGLWVMVPAVVMFHLGATHVIPDVSFLRQLAVDFFQLLEWGIVSSVSLVTLLRISQIHEHQERIKRDMEMAGTLQMALVPRDYEFGRVSIRGLMRQCQDIGGDFYYFRPFQEKYVVFCLGDVMGKGIPASMVMAIVMGFFFEWGKKSSSPSVVLAKLNHRLSRLWEKETTWFTTLFYAVFDEETGVLTYASGGHRSALLLRATGAIEELAGEGLPIGAFDDGEWEQYRVSLNEGDRVLLFTDGLTEARNSEGELFSIERVRSVICSSPVKSSSELLKRLESAVMQYTRGALSDDFAVLLMEVKAGVVWLPKTERPEREEVTAVSSAR